MKLGLSISSRRVAQRVATVDTYEFPSSLRRRVRDKHPDLRTASVALAETGLRQWFRILARRPSARLAMPSMLVDDMWHEFMLHTRYYAAFCEGAFGQFLHHEPESAMSPDEATANRSDRLLITLRLVRQDEHCGPLALPLLFRVDQEVELEGSRHYLVDCGEREQCYGSSQPGLVCLHHLNAPLVELWVLRRKGPLGCTAAGVAAAAVVGEGATDLASAGLG